MTEETVVFKDRVALVTGAAGNIGRATCRMLCQAGVRSVAAQTVSDFGHVDILVNNARYSRSTSRP